MAEEIVAQVELDVARDADHDPAGQELEDAFDQRQSATSSSRIVSSLCEVTPCVQVVDGAPDDQREENPDAVVAAAPQTVPKASPLRYFAR